MLSCRYQASAAITKVDVDSNTISTSASTLNDGAFWITFEIGTPSASALSDSGGDTFAVVNSHLVAASGTTEGHVTVTPKAYTNAEKTAVATADQLKSAANISYNFTITATGRTRIGIATNTYGNGKANTLPSTGSYQFKITANGALKVNLGSEDVDTFDVYYSISGDNAATDRDFNVGDEIAAEALGVTGGFGIDFAA